MRLSPKLLLALAFALSIGVRARAQEVSRDQLQAGVSSHAPAFSSIPAASDTPGSSVHPTVTHYATESDGDHSLQEATVVEQAFSQYTLYTVHLQFASGVEQSVILTAPPGGLQPEMRDMSGDSVPNDLVLTSKLLGLPLIVLLNEGHDHLTVAISRSAIATGEDRASGPHQAYRAAALVSPRLRSGEFAGRGGPHDAHLEEKLLCPLVSQSTRDTEHPSASGRAPPSLVTPL